MKETKQEYSTDTAVDIRITGLNRDKTRRTNGSDARYQVYFELSGTPVQAWRTIFKKEWKALNLTKPQIWPDVNINNRFLVVHCSLQEIADIYLPSLKKAVDATNREYNHYVIDQTKEQQHRKDIWTDERKVVDKLAESLQF